MNTFNKQPGDRLDYDTDLSNWLPEGDTIITADATVIGLNQVALDNPDDELVILATQLAQDEPVVKTWVEKGVDGGVYKVTITVATAGGRVKESEFRIRVKEQ